MAESRTYIVSFSLVLGKDLPKRLIETENLIEGLCDDYRKIARNTYICKTKSTIRDFMRVLNRLTDSDKILQYICVDVQGANYGAHCEDEKTYWIRDAIDG